MSETEGKNSLGSDRATTAAEAERAAGVGLGYHERDAELGILNRIFHPIGRILESENTDLTSVFFTMLHPTEWEVIYYGVGGKVDREAGARLHEYMRGVVGSRRENESWTDLLDRSLREFKERGAQSDELRGAAIHTFQSQKVRLGSTDKPASRLGRIFYRWYLEGEKDPSAPLWFQDALEFASEHQFLVDRLKSTKESVPQFAVEFPSEEGPRATVLVYRNYMTREGLINRGNFEAFLAEYLYYCCAPEITKRKNPPPKSSELDHYFFPLSGLGQWRAAACWLSVRSEKSRAEALNPALSRSLSVLCSQALIEGFSLKLARVLVDQRPELEGREAREARFEGICEAFAVLWWAREIAFFRTGACVHRAARDHCGKLVPDPARQTLLHPSADSRMLRAHRVSEHDQVVVELDLGNLQEDVRRRYKALQPEVIRDLLGFDQVVYSACLFDDRAEAELKEFEEHLGERIAAVITLFHNQRLKTEYMTLEAIGHTMKNTVKAVGWYRAWVDLRTVPDPQPPAVAQAIQALGMFMLVEGLGGLLRLASMARQGNLDKLSGWTNMEQLAEWKSAAPEVFRRYVDYFRDVISVICYGLRGNQGFQLRVEQRGEQPAEEWVATDEPLGRSIEDWFRKYNALPPFRLTDRDSHLALFACLNEPVSNALQKLDKERKRGLFIVITDDLPRAILVTVGNRTDKPPSTMPPGLSQARALFGWTHLATIEEGAGRGRPDPVFEAGPDGPAYWITVRLHPQQLARRILGLEED